MQKLIDLVEGFSSPGVVLVGDFMLDRWVYGDSERLSQEAPVPVLKVSRSESRTGGAGNVAAAIAALGGKVACVGVIGADQAGRTLSTRLSDTGADVSGVIRLEGRPTTVKTRYVGLAQHKNPQQMLRVDDEVVDDLPAEARAALIRAVGDRLKAKPVLAIQDHNKGVLTDACGPELIASGRQAGCEVIVDPALVSDYARYRGATLLTPNRYEASLASGVAIGNEDSLRRAAGKIIQATGARAVMITLDREGIFVMSGDGPGKRIGAQPRSVYDGTGAGDVVLASVAVAVGQGCGFEDAAALANVVGGLEVERFGVVPITIQELIQELYRIAGLRGRKVLLRQPLAEEIARRRRRGETIVFTNGCFDLLHMGHLRYLRQARRLGSCLVVALNSDESVRRVKGPGRPVIGQDERAEMLAALECVDYVTIFDEDTPIPLLELLKPDLLVKGGTTAEVVGRQVVEGYGGKVCKLDLVEGLSTTEIINRIVSQNDRR